ncbi:MAG: chemotaxis protein CheB [Thermoanaerobaculales bacterium]|nr:chemotaxis protein CheB [Thermoanaerobaculales bacterium]
MSAGVPVILADRSPSVRAVLRRLLEQAPEIEVVADSDDGLEVVRLAAEKAPAAIVLDLDLPSLGGRALVKRITAGARIPIFVLTPRRNRENTRTAMSLQNLGVVAVFPKPEAPSEWNALGQTLAEAVRQVESAPGDGNGVSSEPDDTPTFSRELRYVAVGASTGGPGAMYELLAALGRRTRVGVAVVQHIAEGFEGALAEWLATELGMDVAVARHGERLSSGKVRIAPPGHHMLVDRGGVLRLDQLAAPVGGHRPAVEVLFRSLCDQPPGRVAAVLLSGMGSDGADAMAALRNANVLTVAQDKASCAVYGMPRAAIDRRAAAFALAPPQIGRLLAKAGGAKK